MNKIDFKHKKLYLLDMDGTLYLDNDLFSGTKPFLAQTKALGARCIYLTNNSSKSVEAYVSKMNALGIATTGEDFVTSVDATIEYLKQHYQNDLLYVLGTASFYSQLEMSGLCVTTKRSEDVKALVMGFDTELTFSKLEDASILLKGNIGYVAANPDLVCPTAYGYVPDCGSVAEMLQHATGRTPLFIGKPQTAMVELAIKRAGVTREETVLIGDRVYTDIACGINAGIDTVMVLSGEGTEEEARERHISPTMVVEDIGNIAEILSAL